jgi:hypothetical protein
MTRHAPQILSPPSATKNGRNRKNVFVCNCTPFFATFNIRNIALVARRCFSSAMLADLRAHDLDNTRKCPVSTLMSSGPASLVVALIGLPGSGKTRICRTTVQKLQSLIPGAHAPEKYAILLSVACITDNDSPRLHAACENAATFYRIGISLV